MSSFETIWIIILNQKMLTTPIHLYPYLQISCWEAICGLEMPYGDTGGGSQ